MKKLLKILGISTLAILLGGVILFLLFDKALPQGQQGPEAEALADKMLEAVDLPAWDSTCLVQWHFPSGHDYVWDKERGFCEVKWGDKKVLLHTDTQKGLAYEKGKQLEGKAAEKLVQKAWAFFANDSYWLVAPNKIRDSGTERRLVDLENGEKGLLVTYKSGGVTPGDSYLWKVDAEGLPLSVQMWVKIIPIGGLEFSWNNWQELSSGALIGSTHKSSLFTTSLTEIKSAQTYADLGLTEDIFKRLSYQK